ncbi:MAG: amidohydrolase family protein [Phycisphaerae bacterium]|nr:amidohydrolase family protein [Phycisphaerae bacterium]
MAVQTRPGTETMIVDCHTHVDPTAGEAELAAHRMAAEMVDACLVLACPGPSRDQINEHLARYVDGHKDKMVGLGLVEPTEDEATDKTLKTFEKLGLKGFVLYCGVYGFHPMHSRAVRFYEAAQEAGLPVVFHNADLDPSGPGSLAYVQPFLLDEVAKAFPRLRIVVGGMGVPFVEQTLAVLARHEHAYADLTIRPNNVWQTYNMVMATHEYGVMDKLLFGSGYPSCNATDCIETLLGFNMLLADTSLPTVPRSCISSVVERNALEVLGIKHSITSA